MLPSKSVASSDASFTHQVTHETVKWEGPSWYLRWGQRNSNCTWKWHSCLSNKNKTNMFFFKLPHLLNTFTHSEFSSSSLFAWRSISCTTFSSFLAATLAFYDQETAKRGRLKLKLAKTACIHLKSLHHTCKILFFCSSLCFTSGWEIRPVSGMTSKLVSLFKRT